VKQVNRTAAIPATRKTEAQIFQFRKAADSECVFFIGNAFLQRRGKLNLTPFGYREKQGENNAGQTLRPVNFASRKKKSSG
jgi:hypothetical protein